MEGNGSTKHGIARDGEKQPIVHCSRHTSFLRAHKDVHTSGGNGDFGACGSSKVTYFRWGFIQYAIDLKPPSFSLSLLPSVAAFAQSACLGRCVGVFSGESGAPARHVFTMSA